MPNTPTLTLPSDQPINLEQWLQQLFTQYPEEKNSLIRQAATLARLTGADRASPTGQSCLQQGLFMADILRALSVDQETLAAAMLCHCARFADLAMDDITEHLNAAVAKLIMGVKKMDVLQTFSEQRNTEQSRPSFPAQNNDNIRKMLLAMVDDARVVLIKLAEKLATLRHMAWLPDTEKQREAKRTQDIYAPLANRLGIGQLKWELEDLSFRYLEPTIYNNIDTALNSTRGEQEHYVEQVVFILEQELKKLSITGASVSGRAKHIYSIYRKMKHKNVDFSAIYDIRAFRLLLPTVEDCYAMLGHIHSLWTPISQEFDDYVAKPKSNGYRSIHTAVIGPANKIIEIQLRTFQMHEQAELGVAAHWIYKEGKPVKTGYDAKINWLRQVMDWQLEVAKTNKPTQQTYTKIFDDHIYVFTPQGEIVELGKDATPLDFAYHIHTSLGHRCRGARVNDHIVQLTHALKMGDRVEILVAKEEHPRRDWLVPTFGYLKTSRAKAKVLHWFRMQHADENLAQGQTLLEKELRRLGLKDLDYEKLAKKLHLSSATDLLMSLGRGDTTLPAVLNAVHALTGAIEKIQTPVAHPVTTHKPSQTGSDIEILGVDNLLTHMAACCKPVPGDAIMGYVTQGSGVSVHRQDCANLLHMHSIAAQKERLIQVNWGEKIDQRYSVDLVIDAHDRPGLVRDLTQLLMNENIAIMKSNCTVDKNDHTAHVVFSVAVSGLNLLSRILERIVQLPNVIDARRV